MASDDLGALEFDAGEFGALCGHELVAGAVGSVAADAVLVVVFVRKRVHV